MQLARELSDTPTVQVAEAVLVALPQLVEVLGAVVAFLDDGPATFWWERGEVELRVGL